MILSPDETLYDKTGTKPYMAPQPHLELVKSPTHLPTDLLTH